MKILYLSMLLILCITSCKKTGCTDMKAINYNLDAQKENGSCNYIIDKFIGTYSSRDSLIEYQFFGTSTSITKYSFQISRVNSSTISFSKFMKCSDELQVSIDTSKGSFVGQSFCDWNLYGNFYFVGDTLFFYSKYSSQASDFKRWGKAIKN